MSNRGILSSAGWTVWPRIVELIGDDRCLWTDLGGLHYAASVPARLPVGATHLWSWQPDRWTRVRIDVDRALATTLVPGATGDGVAVNFMRSDGISWGKHERAAECQFALTLVRTEGPAPVTFIAACTPTA